MNAEHQLHTVWRVAGTVAEVRAVLADGPSLPRWWRAVYLAVETLDESGGAEIALFTHWASIGR